MSLGQETRSSGDTVTRNAPLLVNGSSAHVWQELSTYVCSMATGKAPRTWALASVFRSGLPDERPVTTDIGPPSPPEPTAVADVILWCAPEPRHRHSAMMRRPAGWINQRFPKSAKDHISADEIVALPAELQAAIERGGVVMERGEVAIDLGEPDVHGEWHEGLVRTPGFRVVVSPRAT